jgi:hypothetical protein
VVDARMFWRNAAAARFAGKGSRPRHHFVRATHATLRAGKRCIIWRWPHVPDSMIIARETQGAEP